MALHPGDRAPRPPGQSLPVRVAAVLLIALTVVCVIIGALVISAVGLGATLSVALVAVGPPVGIALHGRGARPAAAARAGAVAAAATVVGVVALTGAAAVLGAAAGPVLLLICLLLGWWAWTSRRELPGYLRAGLARFDAPRPNAPDGKRISSAAATTGPPVAPLVLAAETADASVAELCRAWQRSYWLLLELPEGPPRDEVIELRRLLLDELQDRDPTGFDRWLSTTPRASSDPRRHLDVE